MKTPKRTEFDIFMEMYAESHKDAPGDPYQYTKMRFEELVRSRELKRNYQGNKRPKNPFHTLR